MGNTIGWVWLLMLWAFLTWDGHTTAAFVCLAVGIYWTLIRDDPAVRGAFRRR